MDDMPMCVNTREKIMMQEFGNPDPGVSPPTPKRTVSAFVPFARSTWIHPHVPIDDFDRVCKTIWSRAKEAEGRGQRSPETWQNKDCTAPDNKPGHHRAEEQQREADDLGLSARYEEDKQQYHVAFALPSSYLSGPRRPHDAEPERVLSPVMEGEMKRNEEEAKRKRSLVSVRTLEADCTLEEDAGVKQMSVENSLKKILVSQSSSRRRDKQTSGPQPQPLATNPVRCESEDEKNIIGSSDSGSSDDDDFVALPGVRSCGTDSSDSDSEVENDCEEERNKISHSFDGLSSDGEQDSPSPSTEKDFPPESTIKAGILPCPTRPPAAGKMHSQWETPLSFHPHDIPTATLASCVTAHVWAPVQGKAKAPRAKSKNRAPPAAPTQQEAYDLLADFPVLQPPEKPLGVLHDGNPKTKGAEGNRGITDSQNQGQESRASHQRRMENVPHEVSSICEGDQKSVLDLQTFGSTGISPTISCEVPRANNQPPPRVAAGTDGMDVNARSWASAAKAGMKQAAAPQEKARPCTFQQIVTINRAKAGYSAAQNFPNRGIPFYRAAVPVCHGPQPPHPNRFVIPGYPPTHEHFGAQPYRANCPPGFRYPRFPFQQGRGYPSRQSHV
ncbi:uncharacterized protein c19h1orf94 isoform X1 [Sebastes fasciatus]|uniref:uncharacterized protein c19h1orf94 isoform X1 n=1 Tax=Sebastes fasciatus TaxID=394691 RepID=UPI003D9E559C